MKLKRAAALAAALLFIILAVALLIMAVAGAPSNYLMAGLLCLVLIPVFFYAGTLMIRITDKKKQEDESV